MQGDVVGILDSTGNEVATYTYDAWGNITSSTGTMATINPIRYRGYYYDDEIEMYYLQSRYYDSAVGRFINADDTNYIGYTKTLLSINLYTYCENNSINYIDVSGFWAERFKGFSWAKKGFNVIMNIRFLSRAFCLIYAADIIRLKGSCKWFPLGWYYKGCV